MGAKEEMMGRIRRALSDTPRRRGEEAPALDRPQLPRTSGQGLARQFKGEMEKLGGRVVETGSEEELIQYIDSVVRQATRAAVSDLVSTRWPGICGRLRARGIEIVPSLGEFAISYGDARGATTRRTGADGTGQRVFDGEQDSRLPLALPNTPEKTPNGAAGATGDAASIMDRYKLALFDAGLGITTADYAIADTGTLVLLSKKHIDPDGNMGVAGGAEVEAQAQPRADGEQHRLISLVPPVHICLLDRTRIVANLTELLSLVHKEFYLTGGPPLAMTFISGPSRTADIELTLTKGVHGPREVHVLLWESMARGLGLAQ